ncbi:PDZ domain-containing protein GIPC2 [Oopsacas minuta]|uniref:PDZ domain-containing protein GIPC2 n=1 Tax=Oopsacas minuta TaxID=111878 RepID=A0AAV7JXU8_9METZ|nr:PDZ domain-containing protein GIPC2 [Oopsacas minuta]
MHHIFKRDKSKGKLTTQDTDPLPPPEQPKPPPDKAMTQARSELVFHAQLAHGSSTKKIKDFKNVKELYQRIAESFDLAPKDIIFCTLNTHKPDMSKLLGGQINLMDFIYAHCKGESKEITIVKSKPSLGLTITDNGAGHSFIKRVREDSLCSQFPVILVGDHLEAINGANMVGKRHYEVAKTLKELPMDVEFSIKLVETLKAFEGIAPRVGSAKTGSQTVLDGATGGPEDDPNAASILGAGKHTLRLKANGAAVIEEILPAVTAQAVSKIDDFLENFMGIRDTELSQTILDIGNSKAVIDDFALAVDNEFSEFEFPDEFIYDVWEILFSMKGGAATEKSAGATK